MCGKNIKSLSSLCITLLMSSALLQHKIDKYRTKSFGDARYQARLFHYISQNRAVDNNIDDLDGGDGEDIIGLCEKNVKIHRMKGGASDRKGPEQSATLYKVGTKKTDNDGNKWIIDTTSTGVKRWKLYKKVNEKSKTKSKSTSKSKSGSKTKSKAKSIHSKELLRKKFTKLGKTTKSFVRKDQLTSKTREYLIHDNGGRPFKFVANKDGIEIYTFEDDKNRDWDVEPEYDVKVLTIKKFIGFWVGLDTSIYTNFHGNSILVQETKTSYVSVGWMILRFETSEEILDYVSPVGNSDVPYPVAYSQNYVYFMLECEYVAKDQLTTEATPINAEEIYGEFYGQVLPENQKAMKKIGVKKLKTLVKRRW
jgi:hypothetical protein